MEMISGVASTATPLVAMGTALNMARKGLRKRTTFVRQIAQVQEDLQQRKEQLLSLEKTAKTLFGVASFTVVVAFFTLLTVPSSVPVTTSTAPIEQLLEIVESTSSPSTESYTKSLLTDDKTLLSASSQTEVSVDESLLSSSPSATSVESDIALQASDLATPLAESSFSSSEPIQADDTAAIMASLTEKLQPGTFQSKEVHQPAKGIVSTSIEEARAELKQAQTPLSSSLSAWPLAPSDSWRHDVGVFATGLAVGTATVALQSWRKERYTLSESMLGTKSVDLPGKVSLNADMTLVQRHSHPIGDEEMTSGGGAQKGESSSQDDIPFVAPSFFFAKRVPDKGLASRLLSRLYFVNFSEDRGLPNGSGQAVSPQTTSWLNVGSASWAASSYVNAWNKRPGAWLNGDATVDSASKKSSSVSYLDTLSTQQVNTSRKENDEGDVSIGIKQPEGSEASASTYFKDSKSPPDAVAYVGSLSDRQGDFGKQVAVDTAAPFNEARESINNEFAESPMAIIEPKEEPAAVSYLESLTRRTNLLQVARNADAVARDDFSTMDWVERSFASSVADPSETELNKNDETSSPTILAINAFGNGGIIYQVVRDDGERKATKRS